MSVLIKGIEMPKACYECRMYEADIYYCAAAERDIDIPSTDEGRCSFCPLVPVPPHGRLIDADVLFDFILNIYKNAQGEARKAYSDVLDVIVATGDVIPAEEGEA